jgi:hypothetical protein
VEMLVLQDLLEMLVQEQIQELLQLLEMSEI